jgi:diacylglycerol kinase family enzyme
VSSIYRSGYDPQDFTIGVLPRGTGNDFPRALNIESFKDGLEAMADYYHEKSSARKVDTLSVLFEHENDETELYTSFLLGLSISPKIIDWINQKHLKFLGDLVYPLGFISTFNNYKRPDFYMLLSDKNIFSRKNLMLTITNTPEVGGGMMMNPNAKYNDGKMDVFAARGFEKPPLRLLLRAKQGKSIIEPPKIRSYQSNRIAVIPDPNLDDFQIDGDYYFSQEPIKRIQCTIIGQLNYIASD